MRAQIAHRSPSRSRVGRRPARWGGGALAVAATVLVMVAAAATTALVRRGGSGRAAAPAIVRPAPPPRETVPPPRYRVLDAEYERTAAQLAAAVEAERGALSPATVATVEQSLRTIDAAIAEARAALERDPHNAALVEMFSASYQQKLALLKRAAELPSQL